MENANGGTAVAENPVASQTAVATTPVVKTKRKYTRRAPVAVKADNSDLAAVIKAMVDKEVKARLKTAQSAAIKAFNEALAV